MSRRALVVEDDPASREGLTGLLSDRGFAVEPVADLASARALLGRLDPDGGGLDPDQTGLDLAFVDLGLPDGDGMDLVAPLAALASRCAVVVLTGERRVERVVEAMRAGAHDFLSKPLRPALLEATLARLEQRLDDRDEQRRLRAELIGRGVFQGIVGRAPAMRRLFDQVERVAPSDLPVLMTGESGTGKELFARATHDLSRRRRRPFVALNCGAIPRQLAESALFGHVRGAFTGASRDQAGAFEQASGGTLFLDEVGEMPLDLQVVLLRALETQRVRRVGDGPERAVDVRVVAATNRDLADAVAAKQFREDLYFRLRVVELRVPPLRDRMDDVPLLVERFLDTAASGAEVSAPPELSAAARAALARHTWPGNVRELQNAIARAFVLHRDGVITAEDLGLAAIAGARAASQRSAEDDSVVRVPVDATLADAERLLVEAQLARQGGHRARTAQALGIAPKTLYNKCRAWGIGSSDS